MSLCPRYRTIEREDCHSKSAQNYSALKAADKVLHLHAIGWTESWLGWQNKEGKTEDV